MLKIEEEMLQNIIQASQDNDTIHIVGNSGCGKEYTVKQYVMKKRHLLIGENVAIEEPTEYAPFKNAIAKANISKYSLRDLIIQSSKFATEHSQNSHALLAFLSNFLANSSISREENVLCAFDNLERDIISKLCYLVKQQHINVIGFLNVTNWDDKSKLLLKKLVEHKANIKTLKNIQYIITENTSCSEEDFSFRFTNRKDIFPITFASLPVTFENEKEIFREILNKELTNEMYAHLLPIIQICNNDFDLLKILVRENYDNQDIDQNNKLNSIRDILKCRLKLMGADSQDIEAILKYASVLGMYFSIPELEITLEKRKEEFIKFIVEAQNMYIINNTDNKFIYCFAHKFVHKVLESSISPFDISIYDKVQKAIACLHPYEYIRRARYCVNAKNFMAAETLFALYILKSLRSGQFVSSTMWAEFESIVCDNIRLTMWKDCFDLYHEGIRLYQDKDYTSAHIKFECINKLLPEDICCEINIQKSLCLTKKLDTASREKAVTLLTNELKNKDNLDLSVVERLKIRLIVLYSHLNLTVKATEIEDSLFEGFKQREADHTTLEVVAVLNRISNCHQNCEIACRRMKNSVDYFGPLNNGLPRNLLQYYIALTNYSGSLCMCGEYKKSFEITKQAIALTKYFKEQSYPRTYIVANNFIVSGFLCGNISAEDCLRQYYNLMQNVPDSAENIFFTSNLAVFHSLNDEHEKAICLLTDVAQKYCVTNDPERIYSYRYATNLSVFYWLANERQTARDLLSHCININTDIPDGHYMYKKVAKLSELYAQNRTFHNSLEFLYTFVDRDSNPTAEHYHMLGYTFTTLYNWDID